MYDHNEEPTYVGTTTDRYGTETINQYKVLCNFCNALKRHKKDVDPTIEFTVADEREIKPDGTLMTEQEVKASDDIERNYAKWTRTRANAATKHDNTHIKEHCYVNQRKDWSQEERSNINQIHRAAQMEMRDLLQ
jgi:hypothetical protein